MCVCLMDKEKCEKVEKGKNVADHLKLLSPSLQCLCRDQSRMFGVGCGTGIHLVHYTLGRKYLVLSTTRKKKKLFSCSPQLGLDLQALQTQRQGAASGIPLDP